MKELKLSSFMPVLLFSVVLMLCLRLIARDVGGVLELIEELHLQQEMVENPQSLTMEIASTARENAALAGIVDSLRGELTAFNGQSDIIRSLSLLAATSGLRMEKLKPLPSLQSRQLKRVPIDLTLNGEFIQLLKFVNTLETQAGCYALRTLTLEDSKRGSHRLRADILLIATIQ